MGRRMPAEPRNVSLGRIRLHGEDLEFHAEPTTFEAKPGEALALILLFDYREAGTEKDEARLILTAELNGRKLGAVERSFEDKPLAVDDAKGFIAVPFTAPSETAHGRFRIEARYSRTEWDGADQEEWRLEREGSFVVTVRSKVHRV